MAISEKCRTVLEQPLPCKDAKALRKSVMCLAVKYRTEDKMRYGDAVRKAWKETKEKCKKSG